MASGPTITRFDPDPALGAIIAECQEDYGLGGDDAAPWPNNMIARDAVVYGSGAIARPGSPPRFAVDPAELDLCRRLAAEAGAAFGAMEVGMGSEAANTFAGFFLCANADEPAPAAIDDALIRRKFGGAILPPATITAEPLVAAGTWWAEVEDYGAGSPPDYLESWHRLIAWFAARPEFVAAAFVRIGDERAFWALPRDQYPPGTVSMPCVFPRLALGLTRGGSLVGLFGGSVMT